MSRNDHPKDVRHNLRRACWAPHIAGLACLLVAQIEYAEYLIRLEEWRRRDLQ